MPARGSNARNNRSLERGLNILRVFRPGLSALGNSEIAESTGLPKSTVSRLTQTLVTCGFLERDTRANAYRLGPPVLSLSEALLSSSELLEFARPHMRELASSLQASVSLATADEYDMVYLESMRTRSSGLTRRSSIGRRTPIELTAFGRAHLATLRPSDRRKLMVAFKKRHHPEHWNEIREGILGAVADVAEKGYCKAEWLEGVTAIATPIETNYRHPYVLGLSGPRAMFTESRLRNELAPPFLELAQLLRAQAKKT